MEREKIRTVQMNNQRARSEIRSDRMRNERIRNEELKVFKGLDEIINESIMRWNGHMKRMNKNGAEENESKLTSVKRVGRLRKRWMDSLREILVDKGVTSKREVVYGKSG